MRVLSLCDGISGGYMALKKLGLDFEYYAIEFDKFPRMISDDNFKDIIRPCHDVNEITEKNILEELPQFDLVIF